MKTKASLITVILALAPPLHAGPVTSVNYAIPASTLDSGGGKSSSASYANDGSAGGLTGISTAPGPAASAKGLGNSIASKSPCRN